MNIFVRKAEVYCCDCERRRRGSAMWCARDFHFFMVEVRERWRRGSEKR